MYVTTTDPFWRRVLGALAGVPIIEPDLTPHSVAEVRATMALEIAEVLKRETPHKAINPAVKSTWQDAIDLVDTMAREEVVESVMAANDPAWRTRT